MEMTDKPTTNRCIGKGSSYERVICKKLSLWFSDGERDDWFWRSQASGGRATIRGRKNKNTLGGYGDIVATSEEGLPLTKVITIEVKRGYSKKANYSPMALLESKGTKQLFKAFWNQALESCELAKADGFGSNPVLIIKGDSKNPIIFFRKTLFGEMIDFNGLLPIEETILHFNIGEDRIVGLKFESWLQWCSPDFFKTY
jgi:hypothetical protein